MAQLVSARTPAAAGSALAGLQGGIGSVIGSLRLEAIELLAEFEVSQASPREQSCLDPLANLHKFMPGWQRVH